MPQIPFLILHLQAVLPRALELRDLRGLLPELVVLLGRLGLRRVERLPALVGPLAVAGLRARGVAGGGQVLRFRGWHDPPSEAGFLGEHLHQAVSATIGCGQYKKIVKER